MALKDKRASQWIVICLAATNDDGKSSYIWNTRTGEKKFLPKYEALWPEWQSREQLEQIRHRPGPDVLGGDVSAGSDLGAGHDLQARRVEVLPAACQ
jgi:hypothetical protein